MDRAIYVYEQKLGTNSKDADGRINTVFELQNAPWMNRRKNLNKRKRKIQVLLSVFRHSQGMVYWKDYDWWTTIEQSMPTTRDRQIDWRFKEKTAETLRSGLLYDKARPHTAMLTRDFLERIGWTTVSHRLSVLSWHRQNTTFSELSSNVCTRKSSIITTT